MTSSRGNGTERVERVWMEDHVKRMVVSVTGVWLFLGQNGALRNNYHKYR